VNVTAEYAVGINVLADAIHAEQALRYRAVTAATVVIVQLPLAATSVAFAASHELYPSVVPTYFTIAAKQSQPLYQASQQARFMAVVDRRFMIA